MRSTLIFGLCLTAVVYSAVPLLRGETLDICCAELRDCPSGSRCASEPSPCSPEREGYCVPVEGL